MSKNSLYFKVFYFDMAKSRTIRINEPAEDYFLPKQTVNAVITSFPKNDWAGIYR